MNIMKIGCMLLQTNVHTMQNEHLYYVIKMSRSQVRKINLRDVLQIEFIM